MKQSITEQKGATDMIELKLDKRDRKLMDIYSEMYPFIHYVTFGTSWRIESCEHEEVFLTYQKFIQFIEDEVKEALLNYALNGELTMLAETLEREA